VDAVLLNPLGYLQAIAWRIRGLRVRSRNRIASLAGKSRFAYPFWIACREPEIRSRATMRLPQLTPNILPVIDCTAGKGNINETLASLPTDVQPVVVGGPSVPGASGIETVKDLSLQFDEEEVWICPISVGDRLAESAFSIYAEAIERAPESRLFYGDDDILTNKGERTQPHFKPDWNPELFEHHDFLTGASLIKCRRDDLRALLPDNWANGVVRRSLEHCSKPQHVHHILHHRRFRPEPVVPSKPIDLYSGPRPSVTVAIPTRNRADLLRTCIDGLMRANYPDLHVIIIDNESDEPETIALLDGLRRQGCSVVSVTGPFNFSALNNIAAKQADGELLCFLNNDVEMMDRDWLTLLARQATRHDIGAVGARLLYPDRTVQHAGVFTGIGGGAAHGHRFQKESDRGYFDRTRLPQRVSAVTAACLVVSREKFLAVGGFDEENFAVAFNDIDLCLKLNQMGWQSFYEPRATLIHHESKSRGSDRAKMNRNRFASELAALKRKWRTDERVDPFHHPNLSRFCEQFVISL
jgi:GT2 family glycosyltransferase